VIAKKKTMMDVRYRFRFRRERKDMSVLYREGIFDLLFDDGVSNNTTAVSVLDPRLRLRRRWSK